ncbi:MAG: alpha/beta hydrolase [Bacteroidia bacterium]
MKHIFRPIILLCLVIPLAFSCVQETPGVLNETIYVRHEGADMPAYVHGNASEKVFILVVHGAGSFGLAFRSGTFTSELEKRYAVVYWDQRGQSMSQGHYSKPEDIISLMADDMMALVQVLRFKYGEDIKLFVLGHSWGGALSATALIDPVNQSLITGWIEMDGAHDFRLAGTARRRLILNTAAEQIALGNQPEAWEEIQTTVTGLDSLPGDDYREMLRQAQQAVRLLVEDDQAEPSAISSEELSRTVFENNPITWKVSDLFNKPFIYARDIDYSVSDQLAQIRIPSLLLWGKYDISVPPTVGYDAYRRLSSSDKKLVIFDRSVHHPYDTEKDLFAAEVIDFVERVK